MAGGGSGFELENGDELVIEDVSAGDTLLFFAELPEYTRDSVRPRMVAGKGKEKAMRSLASTRYRSRSFSVVAHG